MTPVVIAPAGEASPASALTSTNPSSAGGPEHEFLFSLSFISPELCWEDESLCYFVHQHIIPSSPDLPFPGHLDFLPDLYIGSDEDSCIRPAMQATAYLSFSYFSKSTSLRIKARGAYLAALNSVNRAMHSGECVEMDETLSAIMLLSLFEDMNMERTSTRNSHVPGMLHLLRARGKRSLKNMRDLSLFGWVFTQVLIDFFLTGSLGFNSEWFPDCWNPDDYTVRAAQITNKVGKFAQVAKETCKRVDEFVHEARYESARQLLLETIWDAIMIQNELDAWTQSLPSEWTGRPILNSCNPPISAGHTSRVAHRSKLPTCFWALIQSCLIYFYTGTTTCCKRLLCLELPESSPEKKLVTTTATLAMANIEKLLSDICGSIHILFGEARQHGCSQPNPRCTTASGYLLMWPLNLVTRCQISTAEQRSACEEVLRRIGSMMGLKIASMAAERGLPSDGKRVRYGV
ncbi:hypothetical protein BFJ63_vAg18576 [Fusarium oxysporum f. sp. narcissi]|uniref:Transcription factor domain-containing protein n=1 Tax=Fusarium oxysporum f. sp. narcissi TaxID=451672 RepID=A0A4Q2V1B6_FUSOX|nr:hypothetical protein BFJ63_vAg18576 [Fusarium oxysporum f. sp. narcissi]